MQLLVDKDGNVLEAGMRVNVKGKFVGVVSKVTKGGKIMVYKKGMGSAFDTVDEFDAEELEMAGPPPADIPVIV